jgi:hypothetical protein
MVEIAYGLEQRARAGWARAFAAEQEVERLRARVEEQAGIIQRHWRDTERVEGLLRRQNEENQRLRALLGLYRREFSLDERTVDDEAD